jgi:hypothetical protein
MTGPRPPRRGLFFRFAHAAWWLHVLATLGVLLVLNVIAIVIAAVFFVNFVNEHGPVKGETPRQSAVPADEASALARRFAPMLKFDSRELFVPIRQAAYVRETQLKEEEGRFFKLIEAAPLLDKLPAVEGSCLRSRGCQYFLDVRGVEPHPPKHSERAYADLENHLLRIGEKPTIHAHVTRYDDSGDYAVQYWFLYLFNYRLNEHESDWEQITIRLDQDKNPVGALYSRRRPHQPVVGDREGGRSSGRLSRARLACQLLQARQAPRRDCVQAADCGHRGVPQGPESRVRSRER